MDDQMTMIDNATIEELDAMLETPEPAQPEAIQQPESVAEPKVESVEEQLAALRAEVAKNQKQLKDKEDFINQRNQEIGLLRKQTRAKQQAELDRELTEEEILENPKLAVEKAIERKQLLEKMDEERQAEVMEEIKGQHKQLLDKMVPQFEDSKATILEVMKADGLPEEMLAQFSDNPTATLHPQLIFQLAKRAEAFREIADLKQQLMEAGKKPLKVVENLNNYGKAKSPVTNAPATNPRPASKLAGLKESDIDKMSIEQLNELIKEF